MVKSYGDELVSVWVERGEKKSQMHSLRNFSRHIMKQPLKMQRFLICENSEQLNLLVSELELCCKMG